MTIRITLFLLISLFVWSCHSKQFSSTEILNQTQIDSLTNIECDSLLKSLSKINADTFGRFKVIPADFEGCMMQLDSMTSENMKEWIRCLPDGEFSADAHFGLGLNLRNGWGLWAGSKLSTRLYEMGILHPDDMTSIILDSYQRKIKGEDIRFQEQLKYYQDYWRKSGMQVDSILQSIENKKSSK